MRPAGARNYLRWRRSIDEHLELRRLTWHEYAMFNWLCTKADPRTGTLRTSWPTLADQTTLTPNHVGKLCRALRGKGYVGFAEHRGRQRGLVAILIDKFPLADGTYTELAGDRGRGPAQVEAEPSAVASAEGGPEKPATTPTSPAGRKRRRERGRDALRARGAGATFTQPGTDSEASEQPAARPPEPGADIERLIGAVALEAAPRALRETVELFWFRTGREDLTRDELGALADLDEAHTPAAIQRAITQAVERFRRRGRPLRELTFGYVRESLRHFTTRRAPAPIGASPDPQPTYPPGLTQLWPPPGRSTGSDTNDLHPQEADHARDPIAEGPEDSQARGAGSRAPAPARGGGEPGRPVHGAGAGAAPGGPGHRDDAHRDPARPAPSRPGREPVGAGDGIKAGESVTVGDGVPAGSASPGADRSDPPTQPTHTQPPHAHGPRAPVAHGHQP